MKHNLEQLSTLKSLTLSESERGLIRAHATHLIAHTPTPNKLHSLFQRGVYHGLRIALSSFVFFVFVGGMCSAVADNALPGDPLYTFKINVNEEIKGFFQKTPEEKVAYGAKRVETRVNEIKTLAASKTLTKARQATAQKALDEHIKDLSVNLNTLSTVAPTAALTATANLEDALKANKVLLENSTTSPASVVALETVDNTLKKVSDQEVKILSKEIDSISLDVAATNTTDTTLTGTKDLDLNTYLPTVTSTPVEP